MELLGSILTVLSMPFLKSIAPGVNQTNLTLFDILTDYTDKASNCPSFTQMISLLSFRNKTKPL